MKFLQLQHVCLYQSAHAFPSFPLLAISKPISHIPLHLAERLRFEDITFLEGFGRRDITLTLLRRQEAASVQGLARHMCLAQPKM